MNVVPVMLDPHATPKVKPKATPMYVRLADLPDLDIKWVKGKRYALVGGELHPVKVVFSFADQ